MSREAPRMLVLLATKNFSFWTGFDLIEHQLFFTVGHKDCLSINGAIN